MAAKGKVKGAKGRKKVEEEDSVRFSLFFCLPPFSMPYLPSQLNILATSFSLCSRTLLTPRSLARLQEAENRKEAAREKWAAVDDYEMQTWLTL